MIPAAESTVAPDATKRHSFAWLTLAPVNTPRMNTADATGSSDVGTLWPLRLLKKR
ncbi:MAG: hypothetical protein J7539_13300 [Niabella sp.]|nr:hypothetical protein [Niabella sp.]